MSDNDKITGKWQINWEYLLGLITLIAVFLFTYGVLSLFGMDVWGEIGFFISNIATIIIIYFFKGGDKEVVKEVTPPDVSANYQVFQVQIKELKDEVEYYKSKLKKLEGD